MNDENLKRNAETESGVQTEIAPTAKQEATTETEVAPQTDAAPASEYAPEPESESTPEPASASTPEPESEPEEDILLKAAQYDPTPEPSNKGKGKSWITVVVIFLLAAIVTGAAVFYLFAVDAPVEEAKPKSKSEQKSDNKADDKSNTPAQKSEEGVTATTAPAPKHKLDFGLWPDLSQNINSEAIVEISEGVNRFYTNELLKREFSLTRGGIERDATRAVIFANTVNLRSSRSTQSNANVVKSVKYGTAVDILRIYNNGWAEISFTEADGQTYSGFVSDEFIVSPTDFMLMDRYITTTSALRKEFSQAKWRHAATDILTSLGLNTESVNVEVSVAKRFTAKCGDDIVGFIVSREDSPISLIAIVEFYEGDQNYHMLGIIPGSEILKISESDEGRYDILYSL